MTTNCGKTTTIINGTKTTTCLSTIPKPQPPNRPNSNSIGSSLMRMKDSDKAAEALEDRALEIFIDKIGHLADLFRGTKALTEKDFERLRKECMIAAQNEMIFGRFATEDDEELSKDTSSRCISRAAPGTGPPSFGPTQVQHPEMILGPIDSRPEAATPIRTEPPKLPTSRKGQIKLPAAKGKVLRRIILQYFATRKVCGGQVEIADTVTGTKGIRPHLPVDILNHYETELQLHNKVTRSLFGFVDDRVREYRKQKLILNKGEGFTITNRGRLILKTDHFGLFP